MSKKIVFFLSGSIAAFKAAQVISRLVQDGHEVQTVATPSALKFIGAATLEGLTGKKVLRDLWEEGRAMDHIHLSRWADFGVLCPASANTLAKIANGLGDDLLGAMLLAWPRDKKLHIFPAMNTVMLDNPLTQAHLQKIAELGYVVHPTGGGNLACGEVGGGRLLEPEEILARLQPVAKGKILITGGATREPIDGIRFLSNVSTGQTAATLAEYFAGAGYDVTYLHGIGAQVPNTEKIAFTSFASLDENLRAILQQDFRAVIHAAAVSDYSIAQVNGAEPNDAAKLKSSADLQLKLKANPKILPRLKEYARNKDIKVIGFKLSLNQDPAELARPMLQNNIDAVVANEWSQVSKDRGQHPGQYLTTKQTQSFANLAELAQILIKDIEGAKDGSVS